MDNTTVEGEEIGLVYVKVVALLLTLNLERAVQVIKFIYFLSWLEGE